jgi:hypothetical protein
MSKRNNNKNRYKGGRNHNRDDREMAENFSQLAVKSSSEESSGTSSDEDNEGCEANFPVAMW